MSFQEILNQIHTNNFESEIVLYLTAWLVDRHNKPKRDAVELYTRNLQKMCEGNDTKVSLVYI